jgi:hypothetical protein
MLKVLPKEKNALDLLHTQVQRPSICRVQLQAGEQCCEPP